MKDIHKGVILLLLAILVSVITLSVEERHWNLPFVKFDSQPDNDVAKLQAALLAGLDPTANAQPTAAGAAKKKSSRQCYQGKILRDNITDTFHDQRYVSVKQASDTYIEVYDEKRYLLKGAFETQSASVIDALPPKVLTRINTAKANKNCSSIDMYLAKIKAL